MAEARRGGWREGCSLRSKVMLQGDEEWDSASSSVGGAGSSL